MTLEERVVGCGLWRPQPEVAVAAFSRSYVSWVYNETSDWATWEPGDPVNVGDIGYFDRSLKFTQADTAARLLGNPPDVYQRHRVGRRLHYSSRYFSVTSKVGVGAPGMAAAEVTFVLKRGEGHVLQIGKGICEGLKNERELLEAAKRALIAEDWCLSWILICERTVVDGGFAVACRGQGASFTMGANVEPQALSHGVLAQVGLHMLRSDGHVNHWEFDTDSTPTFDRVWRVRPRLIDRLYGDSAEWVQPDEVYYRPGRSSTTPANIEAMKLRELFESGFSVASL
ncbi:hypothetical protein J7E88_17930 [Streptomyces sp. ISL-10]|uniref:hypothetical protein n=1 Tax=Streptomyces sp. ISL-10 TaxID=2819172 RepID=UPI001BE5E29B|nr:hypothetical protein [Streptomyces sp. ISL-10]MBT2367135.1 hypothetical protein [Streptomyces sp. ISL-10]